MPKKRRRSLGLASCSIKDHDMNNNSDSKNRNNGNNNNNNNDIDDINGIDDVDVDDYHRDNDHGDSDSYHVPRKTLCREKNSNFSMARKAAAWMQHGPVRDWMLAFIAMEEDAKVKEEIAMAVSTLTEYSQQRTVLSEVSLATTSPPPMFWDNLSEHKLATPSMTMEEAAVLTLTDIGRVGEMVKLSTKGIIYEDGVEARMDVARVEETITSSTRGISLEAAPSVVADNNDVEMGDIAKSTVATAATVTATETAETVEPVTTMDEFLSGVMTTGMDMMAIVEPMTNTHDIPLTAAASGTNEAKDTCLNAEDCSGEGVAGTSNTETVETVTNMNNISRPGAAVGTTVTDTENNEKNAPDIDAPEASPASTQIKQMALTVTSDRDASEPEIARVLVPKSVRPSTNAQDISVVALALGTDVEEIVHSMTSNKDIAGTAVEGIGVYQTEENMEIYRKVLEAPVTIAGTTGAEVSSEEGEIESVTVGAPEAVTSIGGMEIAPGAEMVSTRSQGMPAGSTPNRVGAQRYGKIFLVSFCHVFVSFYQKNTKYQYVFYMYKSWGASLLSVFL